ASPQPDHVFHHVANLFIRAVIGTEIPALAEFHSVWPCKETAKVQVSSERLQYMLPGPCRLWRADFDDLLFAKRANTIRYQSIAAPVAATNDIASAGGRGVKAPRF